MIAGYVLQIHMENKCHYCAILSMVSHFNPFVQWEL